MVRLTLAARAAVLAAAACAASPSLAGSLLGGVGSVTSSVGAVAGLGAGSTLGGLTGGLTGSGSGVLGASLTNGGLQPGLVSGVTQPLTKTTSALGGGRAWGTFEDAKGALGGKTGALTSKVRGLGAGGGGLGQTRGVAQSATSKLKEHTDKFVLSRNFELPKAPLPVLDSQGAVKGSASAKRSKVAADASANGLLSAGN